VAAALAGALLVAIAQGSPERSSARANSTDSASGATTTTLQSASGLNLELAANTTYSFEYYILFSSA
jgi:hypothetical protein